MNSTAFTNFTTSSMAIDHVPPDASLEFKIAKITIYVAIFVLTIIGNVLVILVICYDKRMRGSSHILILNLAVCDLITPTISIPFDLAYEEMSYAWPFGSVMCKILWPGQTYTTTCSALFLTAICIDRYRALVYPFKVRWAGKFCLMVFSMYTFAVTMVVPYLLVLHFDEGAGKGADCAEKWPSPQKTFRQAYTIVLFLSQYALPLMIMITLYSITLRSLFNNSKQLLSDASIIKTRGQIQNESRGSQSPRNQLSLQEVRKEQHLKVTKMFITVVIVFAISMFPNQVLWLWVDFGNLASNKYFPMISIICRIFTYSNSVLNPFIYGLYSKDFRSGYKKAGKKISKANKHHQALYHHFNRTDKRQFQSSDISQGINDEKTDLITGNKLSCKRGTCLIKTELETLEEGCKQAKDVRNCLQEQNPLNQNEMHSTGKPATKNSSTSIRIPLSTMENELGVEEESGKRAGLFVNEKDSIDNDVIMNISKCIENQTSNNCKSVTQGVIKKNVAEYLEKLTETKC